MDDVSDFFFGDDDALPEELELIEGGDFPDMFDEDPPQDDEI